MTAPATLTRRMALTCASVLSASAAAPGFRRGCLQKCKVLFCTRQFPWGFNFTRDAVDQDSVEVVQCDSSDVAANISDAHVAIPFMASMTEAVLQQAPQLRLIIQFGVGVEGVDLAGATRHGIAVSNIPSENTGNAVSCAEHVIHLALSLLRNVAGMKASLNERLIGQPLGQTLFGKRVLIVGCGGIAQALIPRLAAFGTHITVVRTRDTHRSMPPTLMPHIAEAGAGRDELLRSLPRADIVVLACTETASTRGLVGREFLSACSDGVRIINVTRGGLLDYDAVLDGLATNKIGGLGLDVAWQEPLDPDDPLWKDPRVVATPHVAGVTELSYRNMANVLAEEIRQICGGQLPSRCLN